MRAVYEMHPKFDFGQVDVVTDRRPLRKLIGFVENEVEDFEFGAEAIGNTVLFVRMEKITRETIPPGAYRGYRQRFEEAYTKISSSAGGSTSHHRIARYNLGGLDFIVRSAFDAYLEDVASKLEVSTGSGKERHREEDLTSYMKAASLLGDAPSMNDTPEAPGLHVIHGGEKIPYAALVEFKTRSRFSKSPWNIKEKLPDLWLSQTPTLIEAAHQNVGTKWSRAQFPGPRMAEFVDITVRDMHAELNNWQTRNSNTIRNFLIVLEKVVAIARASRCPLIVKYVKEGDRLVIAKAETGGVPTLPVEIRTQWSVVKSAE